MPESAVPPIAGLPIGAGFVPEADELVVGSRFVFNQFGDLERSLLRPGNDHSAEDWRVVLEPVVKRYRSRKLRRYFRADAAFAKPEIYEFLEAEGYIYAIRLPANPVLQESISQYHWTRLACLK